jgi:hypothetical protein
MGNNRSARLLVVTAFVAVLILAMLAPAWGQKPVAEPTFTELKLEDFKGRAGGKAIGAEGKATAQGILFSVQDLDLMQPVAVGLFATGAQPVKLEIVKGQQTNVLRRCDTGRTGRCEVRFRTQGNFGIRVLSAGTAAADFGLAVWAGPEVQSVPQNAIVPATGKPGPRKEGVK